MDYHRESYMYYHCEAMCIKPFDGYRKYDTIRYDYPKPLRCLPVEEQWNMGLCEMAGVPYEVAEELRKESRK